MTENKAQKKDIQTADKEIKEENTRAKVRKGATTLILFTLLSRVFGFIRDQVIVHYFGATRVSDVFFAAYTIPNTMRRLVAEGAMTVTFISVYKHLLEDDVAKAKQFQREMLAWLISLLSLMVFIGVVAAPIIFPAFASGYQNEPAIYALGINLTRWMFPYVFFISLVAFAMGVLNAHEHYAAPAFAPVLLNISFILSAWLLRDNFEQPIYALATGVLIGGVLQLCLQVPVLIKAKLWVWPSFKWSPHMKEFGRLFVPQLFGLAIYQVNIIILRQFTSYMPEGALSHYYNADRLMQVAYGVFAVAISQAALPTMTTLVAQKNYKKMLETWRYAMNMTNFVTIPAALGLMAIALPLIASFYFHGEYLWADVSVTAKTAFAFAPGLVAQGAVRSTIQVFYAIKNTKIPVFASLCSLIFLVPFGFFFFEQGVFGLAIVLSLASWLQLFVLFAFLYLKRDLLGDEAIGYIEIIKAAFRHLIAAIIAVSSAWFISRYGEWEKGASFQNLLCLAASLFSAAIIYAFISLVFKFPEVEVVRQKILRRIG